jgi:hypothetical protein
MYAVLTQAEYADAREVLETINGDPLALLIALEQASNEQGDR